ncbi:DUF2339 domain-containing protein [Persicirhabdus sediminis]|uniref:DUF2339 domain-containing protein n=1 Tax=Persicirhabdus sediminis TaxID=454144 RepID=A0A8J7SKG9_9BACT|nr:DUF2339 domain-containing protein [Persicirhabdus sediminis]MBK1789783.1 DUF2339 domain-containing protein [Persicirhabdus sediminis]
MNESWAARLDSAETKQKEIIQSATQLQMELDSLRRLYATLSHKESTAVNEDVVSQPDHVKAAVDSLENANASPPPFEAKVPSVEIPPPDINEKTNQGVEIVSLKEAATSEPAAAVDRNPPESSVGMKELEFGKVWFVRIGMLLLLTSFVFLSRYAYVNWIFSSSAWVKLSLFVIAGGALAGLGQLLEKKRSELVNYAHVLVAGGMATIYYAFYAAHFETNLQVYDSALLSSVMMTSWAVVMIFVASFKRSQIIGSFSLLFAYYAVVVNPAGLLAGFSAVLLSTLGMYMSIRHRWLPSSFLVAVFAYATQFFWISYHGDNFSATLVYLFCFLLWAVLMLPCVIASLRNQDASSLNWLIMLNNGAFLASQFFCASLAGPGISIELMLLLTTLVWGGIASYLYIFKKQTGRQIAGIFSYQSLISMTLAIIFAWSGYTRFLAIALSALSCLYSHKYVRSRYAYPASLILLLVSLVYAGIDINQGDAQWISLLALSSIVASYTLTMTQFNKLGIKSTQLIERRIVAVISWLILLYAILTNPWIFSWQVASLLLVALLLDVVKLRKLQVLCDDLATPAGVALFGVSFFAMIGPDQNSVTESIALSAGLIFVAGYLWFTRVGDLNLSYVKISNWFKRETMLAVWLVVSFLFFVEQLPSFGATGKYYLFLCLPLILHSGGEWLGRRSIQVIGLTFYLFALALVQVSYFGVSLSWFSLMFLLGILTLHLGIAERLRCSISRSKLGIVLTVLLTFLIEGHRNVLELNGVYLLCLVAVAMGSLAWWRKDKRFFPVATIVPIAVAILWQIIDNQSFVTGSMLPASLLVLVGWIYCEKYQRLNLGFELGPLLLLVGQLVLLLRYNTALDSWFAGNYAIGWSLMAALQMGLGFVLKSRAFRWSGLVWIALSFAHIVLVDIWSFGALARIFSLLSLGLILLVLGYIYNRYQSIFKKYF